MRRLSPGTTGQYVHVVGESDTATHWRNDLPVLATPVLFWLGEVAAMDALADALDEGEMTVGLSHDASHLAPTLAGQRVTVRATLLDIDGRRLSFEVSGDDGVDEVLRGTHRRALVSRQPFVSRLAAKRLAAGLD